MKSLYEFYYDHFDSEHDNLADATEFLNYLLDDIKENQFHDGDCVKQNVMCVHCYLNSLFEKYYIYTKENYK